MNCLKKQSQCNVKYFRKPPGSQKTMVVGKKQCLLNAENHYIPAESGSLENWKKMSSWMIEVKSISHKEPHSIVI